jgi:hypothetical protein
MTTATGLFTIDSKDGLVLLKDGKPFFKSPIANKCMAEMNVGCVMPTEDQPTFYQAGWANGTVIVGTGNCCEGYVISLVDRKEDDEGRGMIAMIQGIDFNVFQLNPVFFRTKGPDGKGGETTYDHLGVLATGAGCSGKGVRFIHFKALPIVTLIVSSEEADSIQGYTSWFHTNPLERLKDIWDRFEKHGIDVDRERTLAAQKEFSFFRRRR